MLKYLILPLLILTKTKMKKIILTAAAVFAFSFANAQDSKSVGLAKGDIYVTGTVSSVSTSGSDSATSFAPAVGYFLTDNVALSAGFATASAGEVKESTFSIGAAYVFNAKNQFSSNVSLGLGFGSGTNVVDYKTTTLKLAYGINYFVSSHFAVMASIAGLNYVSATPDGGSAVSTTTIGIDMRNLSLGLAYKF